MVSTNGNKLAEKMDAENKLEAAARLSMDMIRSIAEATVNYASVAFPDITWGFRWCHGAADFYGDLGGFRQMATLPFTVNGGSPRIQDTVNDIAENLRMKQRMK